MRKTMNIRFDSYDMIARFSKVQIACQNGHLCHIRRTVCA